MNNRKQNKQPLFAEVNLTGDEFQKSPSSHMQRTRFLKLVYPNNVTLILPGDISASQLGYLSIRFKVSSIFLAYASPRLTRYLKMTVSFIISIWKVKDAL